MVLTYDNNDDSNNNNNDTSYSYTRRPTEDDRLDGDFLVQQSGASASVHAAERAAAPRIAAPSPMWNDRALGATRVGVRDDGA